MTGFDLKRCLCCKDEAFTSRFKRIPSYAELEKALAPINRTEKALVYSDMRRLTSKHLWVFEDFWTMPPKKLLKTNLKRTKGLFKELPHQEERVIKILYDIFKNIEVVSVVLRFIDPADYGIMSPPVKYAIRQRPGKNHVDEYLEFLSVLRQYRDIYNFTRIAGVDIALWTLCEKCIFSGSSQCDNYLKYEELLVGLDEEIITKSRIFQELQDELLTIFAEEEKNRTDQLLESASEREKGETEYKRRIEEYKARVAVLESEIKHLNEKRRMYPEGLIKLEDSSFLPKAKLIHDHREGYVDSGQSHFMDKLAGISVVNKVIWSENTKSRTKTHISHISNDGEVTILYVNKDCYAAKMKVFPVSCPDLTHARYFAITIARVMEIAFTDATLSEEQDKRPR